MLSLVDQGLARMIASVQDIEDLQSIGLTVIDDLINDLTECSILLRVGILIG